MTTNAITPEDVLGSFQMKFPNNITEPRIERRTGGTLKTEIVHLWFHIEARFLKDAVKHLFTFEQITSFCSVFWL